jgi:hypothetical protein
LGRCGPQGFRPEAENNGRDDAFEEKREQLLFAPLRDALLPKPPSGDLRVASGGSAGFNRSNAARNRDTNTTSPLVSRSNVPVALKVSSNVSA